MPTPVVREPAQNPDGSIICPGCGQPVSNTKNSYHIRNPDLVDRELRKEIDDYDDTLPPCASCGEGQNTTYRRC